MKRKIKWTILYLLFYIIGYGQNNLSIARTGKDKIVIYNPNGHAITFTVGGNKQYVLSSQRGIEINFPLSNYNVENTVFNSYYNHDSYIYDSLQCQYSARADLAVAERRAWIASLITSLLQGTNTGRVLDILRMLFGANSDVISEIMQAYQSNDTEEQKRLRISKIVENFYVTQAKISESKDNCLQNADMQLLTNKTAQRFHASQFIKKQENFRLEIAPYYVLGFNPMQYHGVIYKRSSFGEISTGKQVPLGCRGNLNFNAYNKYKQRKIDQKVYFVFDYSRSPAIYKKIPDGIFKKDTAYAWNFYSLGIGAETLYRNYKGKYNSSFSFDVGAITSSSLKYSMDGSKKLLTTIKGKSFKEFNIYACALLKQKLLSWLDLYASYKLSASLFTRQGSNGNREIPAYRQFQIGLNFIVAKVINYQY